MMLCCIEWERAPRGLQKALACVEYFRLYLSLAVILEEVRQTDGEENGSLKRVDAEPDIELVIIVFLDEQS